MGSGRWRGRGRRRSKTITKTHYPQGFQLLYTFACAVSRIAEHASSSTNEGIIHRGSNCPSSYRCCSVERYLAWRLETISLLYKHWTIDFAPVCSIRDCCSRIRIVMIYHGIRVRPISYRLPLRCVLYTAACLVRNLGLLYLASHSVQTSYIMSSTHCTQVRVVFSNLFLRVQINVRL